MSLLLWKTNGKYVLPTIYNILKPFPSTWWVYLCGLCSLCEQEQFTDLAEVFGPELEPGFKVRGVGPSLWAEPQTAETDSFLTAALFESVPW